MQSIANTITDHQIRAFVLSTDIDHIKTTIKRNGEIHVRTNRPRGDGGATPWSMYWGDRADAIQQLTR